MQYRTQQFNLWDENQQNKYTFNSIPKLTFKKPFCQASRTRNDRNVQKSQKTIKSRVICIKYVCRALLNSNSNQYPEDLKRDYD